MRPSLSRLPSVRSLPCGLLLALCALASPLTHAALPPGPKAPPGGAPLLPVELVRKASFYGPKGNQAKPATSPESAPSAGWVLKVGTESPNDWNSALQIPLADGFEKGDSGLLWFFARSLSGSPAVGTVVINAHVDQSYPTAMSRDFRAGSEWKLIVLPFSSEAALPPGKAQLSIQVGHTLQEVEVTGFNLLSYGKSLPLSALPQPNFTYEGRSPDAVWRKEALARIDQIRQGDFSLKVVTPEGKPLPNATVRANLRRHSFGFGSAVNSFWLRDPSPNGARYREIVDENFSRVVLENDLKPFARRLGRDNKNGYYRDEWTSQALDWLAQRHIAARGHYLFWGPFDSDTEKFKKDPAALRSWISRHMAENVPFAGSRVVEWDALNHPVAWDPSILVNRVLGAGLHADIMREARGLTKLPLWVNEDQVFRPGRQQEEYFTDVEGLIAAGLPPDGIGNQAHFHASFLPSPDYLFQVSDRFAKLVPKLQITEFDVITNGDTQLQADWTRDCLIMAYSHPAYTGFLVWGFWEGSIYTPEIGLWNKDWTPRPNGNVWQEWVCNKWRTKAAGPTQPGGRFDFRGHEGRYQITVEHEGRRLDTEADLTKSGPAATVVFP